MKERAISIGLLLVSVGCIYLSFPEGPCPLLAWIAFAPAAIAICRGASFLSLLIWSFVIWYACCWWFAVGLINIAALTPLAAGVLSLIPAACGAMPYIAFVVLSRVVPAFSVRRPLPAAGLITLLIWLAPNPFPGNIAHSLYAWPEFIQVARIGGVTLLLFLINLCAFICAMSVTREYKVKPRVLVIGLIIPIATALFGKIALERFELIQSGFSSYRLGLVQPNVPLHSTNGPNQEQAGYLTTPFRLTNNIAGSDPATDLIIWPEIPAAYSVTNQRYDYEWSKRFIDGIKMPILVSDFLYEQKEPDKPPIFYNTLHLLRPNNDPLLVYRKNILIPFGEYVPLADKLPFLDEIFPGVRRYTPGNESMPIRLQGKEISIAPAVCLEAIYPSHIAHFVRNGANVIVNPGNDGYFGKTSGAAVHLALSTFRAVEFGVPLLRVTNSGYSQVVLASGRQLLPNSTALFSESFWTVSVPIPRAGYATDPNLYTLLFCALICLAALILQLKR